MAKNVKQENCSPDWPPKESRIKGSGDVTEAVDCLPSKLEVLSSKPHTPVQKRIYRSLLFLNSS
jgi:hypothetical protein